MRLTLSERAINFLQSNQFPEMKQSGCFHQDSLFEILIADFDLLKMLFERLNQLALPRLIEVINVCRARAALPTVRDGNDRHSVLPKTAMDVSDARPKISQMFQHLQEIGRASCRERV